MQATEQTRVEKELEPQLENLQLLVKKYQPGIISALARYLNFAGTPEKAVELLTLALDQWPEEEELYEQLAFLAFQSGRTSDVEKNLQEAQVLLGEAPFVYSSLGKLCFLKKEFGLARELLGKSLQLNPGDGVSLFFSALASLAVLCQEERADLSKLPELRSAEKELQRAKELSPEMATDDFLEGLELLSQNNYAEACKYLQKSLSAYLKRKLEFTGFHQLFFSFYLEPEKFDLKDLKEYIQEQQRKLSLPMSSEKEFNQLGCCYVLFFISLVRSSEEQLEKALILDPDFEGARKTLDLLEKIRNQMLSLIDSLRF